MFKNLFIFFLLIICLAQSYIIYSQHSDDWLENSVNQAKSGFENFVNPSKENTSKPIATTTLTKTPSDEKVETIITTTTEESFAFKHLSNNVDCATTSDKIESTICQDVDLIDQDKRLNFILKKWNKSTKVNDFKISPQAQWLELRSQTCKNASDDSIKSCIEALTEKRIQAITGQI